MVARETRWKMVTASPVRIRLSGVPVALLVNQLSASCRGSTVAGMLTGVSQSQTSALEEASWIWSALVAGQALATREWSG